MGKSKYNMRIGNGQQFGASRSQPPIARLTLALRAVPVSAGVIGDGLLTARGALVQMAAHGCGTALLDGNQNLNVQPGEPCRGSIQESMAGGAHDRGQLQEWPLHLLAARLLFRTRDRLECERVKRTGGGVQVPLRQMQIPAGRVQVSMTEQKLNGAQIRSGFQQVGSEAMPQGMGWTRLSSPARWAACCTALKMLLESMGTSRLG